MVDPYQAFREQLASHELFLPDTHKLDTSGVIQRFGTTSQPNKKNAWYILFEFQLDSGSTVLAGTFGSWATGLKVNVDMTVPELTKEEKRRYAQKQDQIAKAAGAAKASKQKEAADKAVRMYASMPDRGSSEYLKRKMVPAYGLRFAKGAIYIPLRNIDDELVGMQYVSGAGDKRFFSGTAKEGAFHLIGKTKSETIGQCPLMHFKKLVVAEGYATGASIYQAYKGQVPVVIAFDCGNLGPVIKAILSKYPDIKITIAADNDVETLTPIENPGVTEAMKLAAEYSCNVAIPMHPSSPDKKADWNDVHCIGGLGLIRKQIAARLLLAEEVCDAA